MGDVTFGDVMAQLQRMDARLDTLSTELYQVNVHVGHITIELYQMNVYVGCIARRQVTMGSFCSWGYSFTTSSHGF